MALIGVGLLFVLLSKYAKEKISKDEIQQEVFSKTNNPTALVYLESVLSDSELLKDLREAA